MKIVPKPKSVKDLVFNSHVPEKRIRQYADGKRYRNILLYGPKGTGKTTAAQCVVEDIFKRHETVLPPTQYHAANYDSSTKRTIENDWNWQSIAGIKTAYVILNEVDQLPTQRLREMRAFMDEREESNFGKFIFTTNNRHLLDAPFIDRCDNIELTEIDVNNWKPNVFRWLKDAGIVADVEVVEQMLKTCDGTIRDLERIIDDIVCEYS